MNAIVADSSCHVTVLERLSKISIAVRWHDVSVCHYGAQTWSFAYARREGVCALSGQPIQRKDGVYRPRICHDALPRNHDQMILACVVEKWFP
jgi:hypothetical protein